MPSEGWVRPASADEIHCHEMYLHETFIVSYAIRVASTRKITEQDARKVFTSLFRKSPNLRMVVQKKEGDFWMREMQEEKIDFQVVKDANVYETYHQMSRYTFQADGPLWAARFLPWSAEVQQDYTNLTQMEPSEDQPKKHPYLSHFVIAYHHSIIDGHSCVRIMRHVLHFLNDILSGKTINDSEQISVLLDTCHAQTIYDDFEKRFRENPQLLATRREYARSWLVETLLEKAFPVVPKVKPFTYSIQYSLDRDTTKKFASRCKKEGVTFHTGFCSLINAAIVKILSEAGINKEVNSYGISSMHCVNHRSLYSDCENAFGLGMGMMNVTCDVPKNIMHNFWSHAKQFHVTFKDKQQKKESHEPTVLSELTQVDPLPLLNDKGVDVPLPKLIYYTTTNQLDITNIIGNIGEHVQLDHYDQLTSLHGFPSLWVNTFRTYKGQLMHSLGNNNHLLGSEAAQKISDTIFQLLRSVV